MMKITTFWKTFKKILMSKVVKGFQTIPMALGLPETIDELRNGLNGKSFGHNIIFPGVSVLPKLLQEQGVKLYRRL